MSLYQPETTSADVARFMQKHAAKFKELSSFCHLTVSAVQLTLDKEATVTFRFGDGMLNGFESEESMEKCFEAYKTARSSKTEAQHKRDHAARLIAEAAKLEQADTTTFPG